MFQYFSQGRTPSIHHGYVVYVGYVGWSDMAKLLNEALPALFGPVTQCHLETLDLTSRTPMG
jgi:hypothetical protein